MIEVRIHHAFGAFALDIDQRWPARGITALFGRSGSGKSTVVNAIAGALRPQAARIALRGHVFADSATGLWLAPEARRIGYVFQDARLFPHLDVRSNLFYGKRRASEPHAIHPDAVIELLGIGHLLRRRPHHLSGGEKQRVALGRALLSQPQWLLLDEPLAALDPARKAELLPYIESLRDGFGIPVLYISHALDEVIRLADHLVVLDAGRVIRDGPLLDIIGVPELSPYVGRFEAGAVLVCTVRGHDEAAGLSILDFCGGQLRVPRIASPPGTVLRVRIRARDVALALSEPLDISINNRLPGVIVGLSMRDQSYVDVSVAVGRQRQPVVIRALVTRDSADRLGLETGRPVWALLKTVAMDSRSVGFARRSRVQGDTPERDRPDADAGKGDPHR